MLLVKDVNDDTRWGDLAPLIIDNTKDFDVGTLINEKEKEIEKKAIEEKKKRTKENNDRILKAKEDKDNEEDRFNRDIIEKLTKNDVHSEKMEHENDERICFTHSVNDCETCFWDKSQVETHKGIITQSTPINSVNNSMNQSQNKDPLSQTVIDESLN